jgi:hypothetical protein
MRWLEGTRTIVARQTAGQSNLFSPVARNAAIFAEHIERAENGTGKSTPMKTIFGEGR